MTPFLAIRLCNEAMKWFYQSGGTDVCFTPKSHTVRETGENKPGQESDHNNEGVLVKCCGGAEQAEAEQLPAHVSL